MNTVQNIAPTPESVWAILQETAKLQEENQKAIKELQKTVGGWANNHGSFAEEYFFNSFENGKRNFFGEHFDEIQKNTSAVWQGVKDEYDIVLYNCNSVALIEVKYKAHVNDIPAVLKKAETFRVLFPNYKDAKIYLGLASMSFYPELEQVRLSDYKVRVIDGSAATAAKVRVLITSTDGRQSWTTVGVSDDIIDASRAALVDSIEYKLSGNTER